MNGISLPISNMFGHINLELIQQIPAQSIIQWGFIVSSRFWSCFHSFYECRMSYNIERDVQFVKEVTHFLSLCQHGKYDYISDWRSNLKSHIWLIMFTWLQIYGLVQYILCKNGLIVNGICDHIFHDYKIFQWPKFNLKI